MKFVRLLFISRPSLSISGDIHVGSAPPSRLHLRVRVRRKFHCRAGPMNYSRKIFALLSCNECAGLPAQFSYRAPPPPRFFNGAALYPSHLRNIPRIAVFRRVILARSAKKSRDVSRSNPPLLLASKCSLILYSFVPPSSACCAARGIVPYSLEMKLQQCIVE